MDIFKISIAIVLLCVFTAVLRGYKGEYALLLQLASSVAIGFIVISAANDLVDMIGEIASLSSESTGYLKILLKALSISILTDMASSFCRDSANQTLANGIELIGKTAIFSLCFPLLKSFAESIIIFLG